MCPTSSTGYRLPVLAFIVSKFNSLSFSFVSSWWNLYPLSISLFILIPIFLDIIQSINASVFTKTTPLTHRVDVPLCIREKCVMMCVFVCKLGYEWVCVNLWDCVWIRKSKNVNGCMCDCMFMCINGVYMLKFRTPCPNKELKRRATERSNHKQEEHG